MWAVPREAPKRQLLTRHPPKGTTMLWQCWHKVMLVPGQATCGCWAHGICSRVLCKSPARRRASCWANAHMTVEGGPYVGVAGMGEWGMGG
jgi:hypothetical protein